MKLSTTKKEITSIQSLFDRFYQGPDTVGRLVGVLLEKNLINTKDLSIIVHGADAEHYSYEIEPETPKTVELKINK